MSKKKKGRTDSSTAIEHRDALLRMSFLYQASHFISMRSVTRSSSHKKCTSSSSRKHIKKAPSEETSNIANASNHRENSGLERYYLNNMKTVGQKTLMRIDPSIKRTVCKKCSSLLLPGVSAKFSYEESEKHGKQMVEKIECQYCHFEKVIIMNPEHKLFQYKQESIEPSREMTTL